MIDRDPWDVLPEPDPQRVDLDWLDSLPSITARESESPAPQAVYPMQLSEYDAIRDDIKAAMFDDRALLPDLLNEALAALATIAQSGVDADNKLATQTLRRMCQRAVTGVPFNEREVQL